MSLELTLFLVAEVREEIQEIKYALKSSLPLTRLWEDVSHTSAFVGMRQF
jgi:hypothetical protein